MEHVKEQQKREAMRIFLEKVVVDAGLGRLSQTPNFEEKALVQVLRDLADVTGQKAQIRPSKKSIAGFKMREGQVVGARVTLRGRRMVDFFERLITIVLPRVRDFSGISLSALDQGGALNIGLREQVMFPEISPEKSPLSFSLGVSIVPRSRGRETALEMFKKFGVPFKKEEETSRDARVKKSRPK